MKYFETHAHTRDFSMDGKQSVEELLAEADRLSFASVCLTDHYDKDGIEGRLCPNASAYGEIPAEGEWIFNLEEYFKKLVPLKQSRQQRTDLAQLQIGIELGYADYLVPLYQKIVKDWPFDQVILSTHFVDGTDLYYERHFYEQGKKKAYAHWMKLLIKMMESELDCDVFGHFDYVIRYAPYEDVGLMYDDYPDEFDYLLKLVCDKEVALELNTRCRYKMIKEGKTDPGFVDSKIIRRYLDLGGKLISLSSDSHELGTLGSFFEDSIKELYAFGVRRLCYFKERRPHAINLS